jgi:hypothetical protein
MGPQTPFTKKGGLVRTERTWVLFVATIVICLVGFPMVMHGVTAAIGGHFVMAILGLLAYAGAFAGAMQAWNRWPRQERGDLRADETGLWRGDELLVRRSAVGHGHVLRRDDRVYVRLGGMLRNVDIEVADEEEAHVLLAAMRLDAARSVAQYPMMHGTWHGSLVRAGLCVVPVFLLPALAVLGGVSISVFLLALFASSIATRLYASNQMLSVSVGADGIRIRHLLQRARFVPFSAIRDAVTYGRDITL